MNVRKKIEKTAEKDRENLLNKPTEEAKQILPIAITYCRTLPNKKSIVEKNWHVLQVNSKFKKIFPESHIIAYRRNANLKEIIESNSTENNKN